MTFFTINAPNKSRIIKDENIFDVIGLPKAEAKEITVDMDNAVISQIIADEVIKVLKRQLQSVQDSSNNKLVLDL